MSSKLRQHAQLRKIEGASLLTQVTESRNFAAMTKTDQPTADPVSVAVAADELCKSPRTILHWIRAGKIRATKLGPGTAAYVITRSEIERIKQDEAVKA